MSDGTNASVFRYASFWKRAGAGLVDFLVILPVFALAMWAHSLPKAAVLAILIPVAFAYFGYEVLFHARYGQTLGKMAVGIRVVKVSGDAIGLREAFMRSSVDMLFSLLSIAGTAMALLRFPDTQYAQMSWIEHVGKLDSFHPVWASWVSTGDTIWIWSELITMLFNSKKRALHDFVAGTIVVVINREQAQPSIQGG